MLVYSEVVITLSFYFYFFIFRMCVCVCIFASEMESGGNEVRINIRRTKYYAFLYMHTKQMVHHIFQLPSWILRIIIMCSMIVLFCVYCNQPAQSASKPASQTYRRTNKNQRNSFVQWILKCKWLLLLLTKIHWRSINNARITRVWI